MKVRIENEDNRGAGMEGIVLIGTGGCENVDTGIYSYLVPEDFAGMIGRILAIEETGRNKALTLCWTCSPATVDEFIERRRDVDVTLTCGDCEGRENGGGNQ